MIEDEYNIMGYTTVTVRLEWRRRDLVRGSGGDPVGVLTPTFLLCGGPSVHAPHVLVLVPYAAMACNP